MAGIAVAEAVLAHEPGWRVTLIGREEDAPYNRVLLSQALAGDVAGRAARAAPRRTA